MNVLTHLEAALSRAASQQPDTGGFPYLAACLRQEGFIKNTWYLPSGDSFYFSNEATLVIPGKPLIDAACSCPSFSESELITVLRRDQSGQTTFAAFLMGAWHSGVVKYEVDFTQRQVTYYGAKNEVYKERYPLVEIKEQN